MLGHMQAMWALAVFVFVALLLVAVMLSVMAVR
jgi:hypothetical protein